MKRLSIRLLVAFLVTTTLAIGMALPASASAYSDLVNSGSPSLYWRFGEASGTTAADASGNGRTGTYDPSVSLGGAGAVPGDPDASAQFTGSYSTAGNVMKDGSNTPGPSSFTIQTWVRTTSVNGGWIAGFAGPLGEHDRIIWMRKDGTLNFGVYPGSVRRITTPGSYNDGNWHLVTATLDGSGQKLYVDGALRASDPWTTTAQPSYSGKWLVGSGPMDGIGWSGAGTMDSAAFSGRLDELAIWESTALTPTQIASHYAQVMNGNNVGAKVDPSLTFTVAGRATACNGVSPTAGSSSSGSAANLGRIGATSRGTALQEFAVSSNAADGWILSMRADPMSSNSGRSLAGVGSLGPWFEDPTPFPVIGTEAAAYSMGWYTDFGWSDRWSDFSTSNHSILEMGGPGTGSNCVAYQAQAGPTTPAGTYSTTVTYTAIPRY